MNTVEAMHIRFILSAKSGKGVEQDLPAKIREVFAREEREHGIVHKSLDIRITEYAGHGAELASEWAARYGAEGIVYIGGGDGSVNEVGNALAETECAMGVLPLGTGNDFARSLYPGMKAKEALAAAIERTARPELCRIDLLEVNGHYCVNVLSLGYDTVVLQRAYDFLEKWPKLGQLAYALSVLSTLFSVKYYPMHYRMKDEKGRWREGELPVSIAVMGNGGYYGSGFNPAPQAELQDGLGEFLLAERMSFFKLIPLILKYKKGKHLGDPKIHYFSFTEGEISTGGEQKFPANYDGEIFQASKMQLKMHKGKLRFARLMPFKNQH